MNEDVEENMADLWTRYVTNYLTEQEIEKVSDQIQNTDEEPSNDRIL